MSLSSLNAGSWLRLILTVVLTSGSVLLAYGVEAGYRLLIGCNIVTVAGAFYLESRSERIPPACWGLASDQDKCLP